MAQAPGLRLEASGAGFRFVLASNRSLSGKPPAHLRAPRPRHPYFVVEVEPDAGPPLVPPVVAPGADAGDSVDDEALLGGVVVVFEELLLGAVVLGVVVVLDGLLVSFLPQPNSEAATNATTSACFTMCEPPV